MKNKILTMSFVAIIFGFFIFNFLIEDKKISYTERRVLAKFPEFSLENIINGEFISEFEKYTLDQFPIRDTFRALKTFTQFNIFHKLDNNKIFVKDKHIYKMEYPLNEKKVISFTNKMNTLYDMYLKNMNVYYTIIPDKNYFLEDEHLKIDYDKMYKLINKNIKNMKYIDIRNELNLDSYYYTDIHWRQEKLKKVVRKLGNTMNFNYENNYNINTYEPFYGVYYGQLANNKVKTDTIKYLTNRTTNNAIVSDFDSDLNKIYEVASLGKIDSYDVYLSGATPLITIENPLVRETRELIIFRDSFTSSLAPLIMHDYSKITLVDLRYMSMKDVKNYIEFNTQDILIIYSTLIINNSDTLRY